MEDFIVQVAKEKLEPEVKRVVSENNIALNDAKLMKVLRDLSSEDESKRELADLFFQNSDPSDWTDEQLKSIVNTLTIIDGNDPHKFNISIYLGLARSPIIENYFRVELTKNPQSETSFLAFNYLFKNLGAELPPYFIESFKRTTSDMRPNFYHRLIEGALNTHNSTLTNSILNQKELVDLLFQDLNELKKTKVNSIESSRQSIEDLIQFYNFKGEYKSTYFFARN
jgi:hypothetical protein